jgi:hypothetical protein
MIIDYNDIQNLSNILFEFVYNPNSETYDNLMFEKINISELTHNDIIKDDTFDYEYILKKDKNNTINILDTIIDINSNIKLLLEIKMKDNAFLFMIQKHKEYFLNRDFIDIYYELFINKILSEFIILEKVPFYLLNICNFNIKCNNLLRHDDFNKLVIEKINIIDTQDNLCISIYENYYDYITLKTLLSKELTNTDLYNLLFQMFFSYGYILSKVNNFNHGSFTIDFFLIQVTKPHELFLSLYDTKFKLTNVTFICKLFNFRNSSFTEYTNMNNSKYDSTYDIYTFFKSLYDYIINIKDNFSEKYI